MYAQHFLLPSITLAVEFYCTHSLSSCEHVCDSCVQEHLAPVMRSIGRGIAFHNASWSSLKLPENLRPFVQADSGGRSALFMSALELQRSNNEKKAQSLLCSCLRMFHVFGLTLFAGKLSQESCVYLIIQCCTNCKRVLE